MTKPPKFPVCKLPFSESIADYFKSKMKVIQPNFPNWERSFISGPSSPLYQDIEHRMSIEHSRLVITKVHFKAAAEGPPGHIHGGASAALIDEAMGVVVWNNQFACVTQTLQLSYLKTLPLKANAYVGSEITRVSEELIYVNCTIFDEEKTPYVSSQGVFHRLSPEQLEKFRKLRNKA